jgi:hypothetical protein
MEIDLDRFLCDFAGSDRVAIPDPKFRRVFLLSVCAKEKQKRNFSCAYEEKKKFRRS